MSIAEPVLLLMLDYTALTIDCGSLIGDFQSVVCPTGRFQVVFQVLFAMSTFWLLFKKS